MYSTPHVTPSSLSPFLPEAMYCHAPKPLYTLMLEHLELQFRVASKPVAALITLLIANGTLYILLIPIVVHCTIMTTHTQHTHTHQLDFVLSHSSN